MQSQQLPTESQIFEDEVLAGPESADYPAEEMSERHDHGKNFSGKDRIELCAKSFISQVYELLARHTARQLKELSNQPRKCRSDTIMARIFGGKDRIKLCAKSLISQVYDLLARHRGCFVSAVRLLGEFCVASSTDSDFAYLFSFPFT